MKNINKKFYERIIIAALLFSTVGASLVLLEQLSKTHEVDVLIQLKLDGVEGIVEYDDLSAKIKVFEPNTLEYIDTLYSDQFGIVKAKLPVGTYTFSGNTLHEGIGEGYHVTQDCKISSLPFKNNFEFQLIPDNNDEVIVDLN